MMHSRQRSMNITNSMAQNKSERRMDVSEKIYKTMSSAGACSLVVGIVVLVTGIASGIMMIVSGARLLKKKSEILI